MKKNRHSKRRILSSLSFRINVALIVIMVLVGWLFTKGITFMVSAVNNGNRQVNMDYVITERINDRLQHIDNVIKTGALIALQHRMTERNSVIVRDSIGRMEEIDTVYLSTDRLAETLEVSRCINMVRMSGASLWSEPHYVTYSEKRYPVVTFVTPLRNAEGRIYSAMCADVNLGWLRDVASSNIDEGTEAKVSVSTVDGTYIFYTDSSRIMRNVRDFPEEENGEGKLISGLNLRIGNGLQFKPVVSRVGATDWRVMCKVPLQDDTRMNNAVTGLTVFMLVLLMLLIILSIVVIVNWQLKPLAVITEAADAVAEGHFHTKLPKVSGHSDISHLRDSFVTMQRQLRSYIDDLRVATVKKVSMERDLHIAAKIQQGMLPKTFPAFPQRQDIDIYGMQKPAREVGGDIFDFFMKDDKLHFLIGDVSGKGVPASLFMTVVGHLFRNLGRTNTSVPSILSSINYALAQGNEQNMFCTMFYGVLDMETGVMEYCNAGHNAPVLVHADTSEFMQTRVFMPAGAMEETVYKSDRIQLQDGDAIFLYTDGVTEAENAHKELFGDKRTLEAVDLFRNASMEDMAKGVHESVETFVGGYEQSDDLTILCLRWFG